MVIFLHKQDTSVDANNHIGIFKGRIILTTLFDVILDLRAIFSTSPWLGSLIKKLPIFLRGVWNRT